MASSTPPVAVEAVEGVEGASRKPHCEWQMDAGLDRNFSQVGKLLVSLEFPRASEKVWRYVRKFRA